ncbi:MAG: hypothetical protein ACLFP4_12135 [Spirochaetales bacterium]
MPDGFASPVVNGRAAELEELHERVFDQIAELISLGRRLSVEHTLPALRGVRDTDPPVVAETPLGTADQVLRHLIWHWSFHSGHIGLVRLQLGGEYEWVFADDTG